MKTTKTDIILNGILISMGVFLFLSLWTWYVLTLLPAGCIPR